jgi:hypothetical protein
MLAYIEVSTPSTITVSGDLDSKPRNRPPVNHLVQHQIEFPNLLQSSQNAHPVQEHKDRRRPHGPPEARLWQRNREQVLEEAASPPIETVFKGSNMDSVKAAKLQRVGDAGREDIPVLAVPEL